MLRTNLATRPFYNERAVHIGIALAALLIAVITVLNVVRIVELSRHNTELSRRINTEQAEAGRLTREAAAIRRTINKDELDVVVKAAREANALIDQRTFSWTAFFNHIEDTLPPDVMLTAVRPSFDGERTKVSMTVLARRAEDVDELMEKLEATGAFEDVIPAQQNRTEEGLYRVLMESVYIGDAQDAPAAAASAEKAGTPGAEPKPAVQGGRR
ncbi:MAG TPA: PilN domain-containing protein [Vicinamibacterales bacterium]